MLRIEQIRAARALLGWRQEDLARAADVGVATVRRLETSENFASGNVSTLSKIEQAFERAGVQFLYADALNGIGVRLSLTKRSKKS
ncbi:MAG: helix-turn-helix transcriptional regulator [Pseudorhodoplanes sp.]|jgi:transcriptional regulator with XRE-family HTH domain|nr:helix-turn-helix transcriptional regulator [Pseudorhodoplanes sp.]